MEFIVKSAAGDYNLVSRQYSSIVTSAQLKTSLMSEDIVSIEVNAARLMPIAIGDKINVFGKDYTINQLPTIKRTGTGYNISLTFEGPQYALLDRLFFPPHEDGVRGDSLCLNLQSMVQTIIDNANRDNQHKPFVLVACPEDTEYNNMTIAEANCLKALQDVCKKWEVEFALEETPTAINVTIAKTIGQVNRAHTYTYGKGGGVYNLQRAKASSDIITRLYVYGGTENLMYYRHTRLCMPGQDRWQSYIQSPEMVERYGVREGIKNFDETYPRFTGRISRLGSNYKSFYFEEQYWDAESQEYKWRPCSFNLNEKWKAADYQEWLALRGIEDSAQNQQTFNNSVVGKATKYLIAGTTATVHFQTGGLAGYDIDIEKAITATGAANTEIVLSPLVDENSYEFPSRESAAFQIAVGDEFIFLGINLPQEWKDTAEHQLQEEGQKYYDDNCKLQAKYTLEIEPIWLRRFVNSDTEVDVFQVGDSILVYDEEGGMAEPAAIRIQSMTRDLLDVYKYKLTLTDEVEIKAINRVLSQVNDLQQTVEMNRLQDPNRIRKTWNIKREILDNVFDTEGDYYTDKIKPNSIETQMLAVGARSQQLTIADLVINANVPDSSNQPQPDVCSWTAGTLSHYTINEDGTIRDWLIGAGQASSISYDYHYIYARCNKADNAGTLLITTEQIKYDRGDNYYYFLIGSLSSVDEGTRQVSLTYGFTTINGRYVSTGRITSNDGKTWFDLDTAEIHANKLSFTSDGQSKDVQDYISQVVGADVSEATKNIQVGGRNYLRKTNGEALTDTQTRMENNSPSNATYMTRLNQGAYAPPKSMELEMGKVYTFSGYVKIVSANDNTYVYYGNSQRFFLKNGSSYPVGQNVWHHFSYTFTHNGGTCAYMQINNNQTAEVYAAGWMLESGNTSTLWQQAPEDLEDAINATEGIERRNYQRNTGTFKGTTWYNWLSGGTIYNSFPDTAQTNRPYVTTDVASNGNAIACVPTNSSTNGDNKCVGTSATISAGVHCFSCYIKSTGSTRIWTYIRVGGTEIKARGYAMTLSSSQGWYRLVIPFVATSDGTCIVVVGHVAESTSVPSASFYIHSIKVERGNNATEWCAAVQDTDDNINALDYLKASLTEAASGSVDITGGLLLGSFLGVKEGGVIIAGMNGNANSNLPMLFSGRTDSNSNGTFQVWRDGHIVSTDGNGNTIVIDKDEIKFSNADKGDRNVITSKTIGSISAAVTAVTTGGSSSYNLSKGGSSSYDTIVGTYSNGGSSTYSLPFNKKDISTSELQFTLDKPASLVTMKAFSFTASFSMKATGKAYVSGSYSPSIDVQGMKLYVIVLLKTDGGTKMLKQQSVTLNNTTLTIGSQETKSVGKADISVSAQSFSNMPSGKYSIEIQYAFYEIGTAVANAGSASSSLDGVGVIVNCSHNALSSSGCFTISQLAYGNVMYSDGLFMSSSNNRYLGIDPNATDGAVMKIRTDSGASLSPILLESIGSGKGAHVKITHEGLMHSLTQNVGTYYKVSPLAYVLKVTSNGSTISSRTALHNPFGWSLPTISVSGSVYTCALPSIGTYTADVRLETDSTGYYINVFDLTSSSFKYQLFRNTGSGTISGTIMIMIYLY